VGYAEVRGLSDQLSSVRGNDAGARAIGQNGTPEKITIDKSGANTAAIETYNKDHKAGIEIRQVKYLNNIVEQDHRTDAHDPEGPVADEGEFASGAGVLFASGIKQST
jgi:DDE domain